MVNTLQIKNMGIIENITIDFNEGLNILTGETGAGKTLLIGALNILAGGRFSKDMIRNGEDNSFVEASFYIPKKNHEEEKNVIVSREIHKNGRNSCKVNGRLVTVSELKEFMKDIIDIHGQHDNQNILNVENHIKYLDSFIGNDIQENLNKYKEKYIEHNKLNNELKNTYGDDQERERRLDLLNYQYNEIETANLRINEEEDLEEKSKIVKNIEKLKENISLIKYELNENAITAISNSIRYLEKIEDCGYIYSEKLNMLKSSYYDIQELGRDFDNMEEDIEFDDAKRQNVEQRLDLIYSLKRKYGNSIKEIIEYKNKTKEEIEKINNLEEYHKNIKGKIKILERDMINISNEMNFKRRKFANIIEEKINDELKDLEMKNAKFSVHVIKKDMLLRNGMDEVEFYISTNIGEEEKPLIKIASGGEMSRIMLAIKHVLVEVDEVDTLVFDEIDTGISGKASNKVGEKMKEIGEKHQVICITHLPSIAAKGDYNYYISKQTKEEKTFTSIKRLTEEETIDEIARIASGEVTEIARAHAKELRKVKF